MKPLIVSLLAQPRSAIGTGQTQPQKKTIALVTNVAADFWTIAGRGLEKAQKEHPDDHRADRHQRRVRLISISHPVTACADASWC